MGISTALPVRHQPVDAFIVPASDFFRCGGYLLLSVCFSADPVILLPSVERSSPKPLAVLQADKAKLAANMRASKSGFIGFDDIMVSVGIGMRRRLFV
jgi:hypothetical protein